MLTQLRTRLLLSSLLTIIIVAGLVVFGLIERIELNAQIEQLDALKTAARQARELSLYVQYNAHDTNAYALGHVEHRQEFIEHAEIFATYLLSLHEAVDAGVLEEHERIPIDQILDTRQQYDRASNDFFAAADAHRLAPSLANQRRVDAAWALTDQLGDQLDTSTQELSTHIAANEEELNTAIGVRNRRFVILMIGSGLLIIGLAVLIQLVVARAIGRPLRALLDGVRRFTAGDMDVRVAVMRRDELGVLADAFNSMVREIGGTRQRLEQWNATLERTVAQRTAELTTAIDEAEAARAAAEQANRAKSQFLANMSHELRTPLNAIINFTRIIATGARGPVNSAQIDYLQRVRHGGEHLLGLINDILDLAKIEAGRIELHEESINVGELLQSVMATASGLLKDKPVELRQAIAPNLPPLFADRTRVRQILLNLLSNAAKFTAWGSITVHAVQTDGAIEISVVDTGIGIAPEHLTTIFEEFRQIDGESSRRYEGTGLGLAICRRLAELHGGRLSVESILHIGSTFIVRLPLIGAHQAVQPPVAALAPITTNAHADTPILVIDDDPAAIEIVATYLGRDGYAIHGVTDSRQALAMARKLQPTAIILDVLMPYKDGWEVLADLKADPSTRAIPVMLYTILDEPRLGFYLGASAYLTKPVDPDQLHTTVARLLPQNATVLAIDDDPDALEIITRQLEGGYQVVSAEGGRAGLARIAAVQPDLIILDLMMPDVDGFAVLEQLDRTPQTRAIPVLVLTAKELTNEERLFLSQRVRGLLLKGGVTPEQLLEKVGMALQITAECPLSTYH